MRTLAALLISLSPLALAGDAFYTLGVSDPAFESFGWAVSADGSTVVGYEGGDDSAGPFFWTATDGVTLIDSPDIDLSTAVGVSADGSVLTGNANLSGRPHAWRWARGAEIELLSPPTSYRNLRAWGISADGAVVVGTAFLEGSGFGGRACRWTREDGAQSCDPDQPSEGYATSANGEFVTGGAFFPFLWSTSTGLQPLPSPPEADVVYAYAMSGDGAIQAGEAYESGGANAIEWQGEAYSLLQPLPGAGYTAVYAVSGDGRILAGRSSTSGLTGYNAAVWDEQRRVINLNDYIDSIGLDRAGLHLAFIRGLSHDGRVLAGWGEREIGEGATRREAWVAVLDGTISCAADITHDDRVDFADLNLVIATFGCIGDGCEGDTNGDGRVDFTDLNEVLTRFGLVCVAHHDR